MSDRERPTGRDSKRVTDPTQRASGAQRVTGSPRVSGTQRATGSQPGASSDSNPTTPRPLARAARLRALLILAGAVVLGGGLLLFTLWSDRDDEGDGQSATVASTPAAPTPVAAPPAAQGTAPAVAPPRPPPGTPPATAPDGVAPAPQPASPTAEAAAHGKARDGGTPLAAETRRAATTPAASDRSKTARADAGAPPAAKHEAQTQTAQAPDGGVPPRRDSAPRRPREDDDDAGQVRVARFTDAGGADLEGRVVNVDTGRALPGIAVDVRLEGRYVEVETGPDGSFRAPGMVPGSKVLVWIGGRRDRMVAERFDVRIPDTGKKADLGMVRLLDGDELDSRLDGWIGLYVTRKDEKIRVSAVNAWVPANSAGIEAGDAVLSVDGRDVKGLGPRSVSFLLRGPSGSATTLEIESADGKRRKLTLKRVTR